MGVYYSPDEQILEAVATPFNTVAVVACGERVNMDVTGATFATWHPRHLLTGYSWDALAAACLLRADGPPASVLLLGIAGGTMARQLRALVPEAAITGVDIDREVIELARRHMALDEIGLEVVIGDALQFLVDTERRFDVVVDDLFLSGSTDVERSHIPPAERLALIRSRIVPGGLAVTNLITDADGPHWIERKRARRAFVEAFPVVRVVTPPLGLNEILVGGERSRTAAALRAFAPRLAEPGDRRHLADIRVRRLRRRTPTPRRG
jgi:predicted membrane-bound spermidine synthase